MKQRFFYILFLCTSAATSISQNRNACLEEIERCETLLPNEDSAVAGKVKYVNYQVRVINWEDEVADSHVKLYSDEHHLNFLSDQAIIYRNDREVAMALPQQKIIVLSSTSPELNQYGSKDELYGARSQFLKSCVVTSCEDVNANRKRTVLTIDADKAPSSLKIKTITYEYDPIQHKILNIKTDYNEDYKLRQIIIIYKEKALLDAYVFLQPEALYRDKSGHVPQKYREFELVDSRDPVVSNKGKKEKK